MENFLKRILSDNAKHFDVNISNNGKRYFRVFTKDDQIIIEADSKIHIAVGLYRYLKDVLHINYSWCGNTELKIDKIILPKEEIYEEIPQEFVSMFNYCTYGYSMPYWNWERWEKELDFMAMNGVNLPLCVVGIEAVWYKTLLINGCTKQEALSFISSPSHFPWQLMTNIEGVMPIMSEELIEQRLELGQKIINRMLEFGMQPIQMGFSGFVPEIFKKKYFKDADIRQKKSWCGMNGTWELNPKDPLFTKLGVDFLNVQKELFGAYHYYACDPFHESAPPVEGKEYLVDVSKSIQNMYESFDKDYVWVMQSWSIRKDIVNAVSKDKLLILDLAGENHKRTNYFWGYKYLSGRLHNFGGRINMHGDIRLVSSNKYLALKKESNIVGTGLFMEGINQNPLYYDLAEDLLTKNRKVNISNYLDDYCIRRYGSNNDKLRKGLKILSNTVYRRGTNQVETSSMVCARPALNVKKSGPNEGFEKLYNKKKFAKALKIYLNAYEKDLKDGYYFDLYDIARQVGSNTLQILSKRIRLAYVFKRKADFLRYTNDFLEILNLMDQLLLTRKEFNLYTQLNEAKTYTDNDAVNDKLVEAHKTLLTVWADIEAPKIFDYAWREWGGIISGFYYKRWQMWFDYLNREFDKKDRFNLKKEKKLPQVHGRESFCANDFYKKLSEFEKSWIKQKYTLKEIKQDNTLTLKYAKAIHNKINHL